MKQPIGPIQALAPTPSILHTARDRSRDDFGATSPVPAGVNPPDGASPPSTRSWRTGVSWVQSSCQVSHAHPTCPDDQVVLQDADDDSHGPIDSDPFWIYTAFDCAWVSDPGAIDDAAKALTEAHTAFHVARAIWLGEGLPDPADPDQPTLRNAGIDVTPGGSLTLDDAVANLLAAYEVGTGGNGGATLHVPSILMTGALGGLPGGGKVATPEGSFYRGPLGSVVSPGPGYPWEASADGPDGNGPSLGGGSFQGNNLGDVWVFVSGPIEYALDTIEVVDATPGTVLRRNVREVWARREAIFRFDPCSVWACLVNADVTIAGS